MVSLFDGYFVCCDVVVGLETGYTPHTRLAQGTLVEADGGGQLVLGVPVIHKVKFQLGGNTWVCAAEDIME